MISFQNSFKANDKIKKQETTAQVIDKSTESCLIPPPDPRCDVTTLEKTFEFYPKCTSICVFEILLRIQGPLGRKNAF